MRKIFKNIIVLLISALLLSVLAMPCFAADQKGRVTVSLCDNNKNDINGMSIYVCQIAGINDSGYYPTKAFENSGISISAVVKNPDYLVAESILAHIRKNNLSSVSSVSESGMAEFSNLELGIWLVYPEENGKHTFNPYVIFLPFSSQGKLHYEISSSPKVVENSGNKTSIYVLKKWDDRNNAAKKRPEHVTVELLNDKTVVDSVTLSVNNAWSHTFSDLEINGKYSVREKSVSDYKATYSGDAKNGFIITNTYTGGKLPQAGQYWWPIVVIAVAGAGFVLLGIMELGAKKNVKKK